MMLPGTMFEEMGFNYIGPIDGHDMKALVSALTNIRQLKGPQFLHVVTTKGKGYAPAEADPITWHGPGPFDPASGTIFKEKAGSPTYSKVFGDWLIDAATQDKRVIGITPAMREGSGLVEFSKRFPERYFDVAIAEQHAVTFAAGMATEGLRPVVAIYSTFLQRGYDQLIHDVALQNLPVVFALDRAGLVGGDGATHQGSFDISFLRCIPNLVVMAPSDENECRKMLQTALTLEQPAAVRYPRGTGPGARLQQELLTLPRMNSTPLCWTCASSSRWTPMRYCAWRLNPAPWSHWKKTWFPAVPVRQWQSCWPPLAYWCHSCTWASRINSSNTARATIAWSPLASMPRQCENA
jgi:1-deoxy-D-xylulose-5-phosphate synthase